MTQPVEPNGPDDQTERAYTPAELEEFAQRQVDAARAGADVDPLTDPIDSTPPPFAAPPTPESHPTEPGPAQWPSAQQAQETQQAQQPQQTPPPPAPPAQWPVAPPPSAPPSFVPPTAQPAAPPAAPPPAAPPAAAPPAAAPAQHVADPAPAAPQPATPQPAVYESAYDQAPQADQPRRFMSATDFLDRRDGATENGPATWGWRGRVARMTGGAIKPRMGAKEAAYNDNRRLIQKDFDGPRTIAFINPKGGAAKTTSVLAAGYTFGTVRGGGVVAWDNNETRGTLGIRGSRSAHRNTTRELLEDLERFKDVYQSRIGDLGAFVRSQGDAHFDVLASDERPDVTGQIHASDFADVHHLLERFYKIILVDTGNNMRAENWLAAAEAADLLVVTSTVREDTGYSGLWMLDALQDAGYANLKYKTVTVLCDPSEKVDTQLAADLTQVYEQRTRGVYRVPYDEALVSGSVVPYGQLSEAYRAAWIEACAGMAGAL